MRKKTAIPVCKPSGHAAAVAAWSVDVTVTLFSLTNRFGWFPVCFPGID